MRAPRPAAKRIARPASHRFPMLAQLFQGVQFQQLGESLATTFAEQSRIDR